MPTRKKKQIALLAVALSAGLVGATTVYAEHPQKLGTAEVPANDGPHVRNSDLQGGFYEDRYKRDNWFYDFYESPDNTTNKSATDRTLVRTADSPDRLLADAAYPGELSRDGDRTHERHTSYQRYYDEAWFYSQRESGYGMPATRLEDEHASGADTGRHDELVAGTVQAVKQVRNRNSGGQNTVALVKTAKGDKVITDLGPTKRTLDMALTQGDQIQVRGQRKDIGDYPVLMANHIKSGANQVHLSRGNTSTASDHRQVAGRIEQFRDVRVSRTGQLHRTATVRTQDGRSALVDLGPTTAETPAPNASAGDHVVASGPVVTVGNYPVLLANRLSINDGAATRIARPEAEFSDPASRTNDRRQHLKTNPDCVGGGCEGNSVNQGQPRTPHGNAMDGTTR